MNEISKVDLPRLERIIESLLTFEGFELVDLEFRKESRGWVLRVFMDKPGGVTLDDCAAISREVGDHIEVEDLIPHSYTLEISSPGLERPLKKEKDFHRSIGKLIQFSTTAPVEGRSFFKGVLLEYQPSDRLILAEGQRTWEIPAGWVTKARLVFEG